MPAPTRTVEKNEKGVLAEDPRLKKPFSLSSPHLPIGDLLNRVKAETGVQLVADDRISAISGYEVTVVSHQQPAHELLAALAHLYSTREDPWHWVRERRGESTRYVLRNSKSPAALREARLRFAQAFVHDQHSKTTRFLNLPADARARIAPSDPYLAAMNAPGFAERNSGFFSFVSGLSRRELNAIMDGSSLVIPTSQLSGAQRAFIQNEFTMANPRTQTGEPLPGADELKDVSLTFHEGTIYLNLGSVGGHSVLGGIWVEQALQEHAREDWLAGGGDPSAPKQPIPANGVRASASDLRLAQTLASDLLQRLGKLGKLNLLFDCPPEALARTFSDDDFTLKGALPDVLKRLGRDIALSKRDGEFLLFRRPDWPSCSYDAAVPWRLLSSFRTAARTNEGYLRPDNWSEMATLSSRQLDFLSGEFHDAAAVMRIQFVLRMADAMRPRERALLSRPGGAHLSDWSPETWARLQVLFPRDEARRVRFFLSWETEQYPPALRFHFGPSDLPLTPVRLEFTRRTPPKDELELSKPRSEAPSGEASE